MVNQQELLFNYSLIVILISIAFTLTGFFDFPKYFVNLFTIIFVIWLVIALIILWRVIRFRR